MSLRKNVEFSIRPSVPDSAGRVAALTTWMIDAGILDLHLTTTKNAPFKTLSSGPAAEKRTPSSVVRYVSLGHRVRCHSTSTVSSPCRAARGVGPTARVNKADRQEALAGPTVPSVQEALEGEDLAARGGTAEVLADGAEGALAVIPSGPGDLVVQGEDKPEVLADGVPPAREIMPRVDPEVPDVSRGVMDGAVLEVPGETGLKISDLRLKNVSCGVQIIRTPVGHLFLAYFVAKTTAIFLPQTSHISLSSSQAAQQR